MRCGHPYDDPGSHLPPPDNHSLILEEKTDWNIQFNDTITYDCEEGTWIENDTLSVPRDNYLDVKCLNINGTYDIPTEWPNCTITVNCDQPPEPLVNGSR